jgi:release factor glutamine methyltransferase
MATAGELTHAAAQRLAAAGIDDARLEAEVLFAQALGSDRVHVLAALHDPVREDATRTFGALIERRLRHEPLAYIVGHREFYGIDIECAPGALIPRPETEMLVEIALAEVRARGAALRLVDVGTGSGAIAVAIAVNAPDVRVLAIDASEPALAVARRNVQRHGVAARVELRAGDLLGGQGQFDVIVANLPYVSGADWRALPPEIRDHEPQEALTPGPLGTEAVAALLAQAPAHLAPGGALAAEMGDTQGAALLAEVARAFPEADRYVMKDLARLDRVLVVRVGSGG